MSKSVSTDVIRANAVKVELQDSILSSNNEVNVSQICATPLFSTTTPLISGATYSSGVFATLEYAQVQTELLSSHDGTLFLKFYSDAAGSDVIRSLTIPYDATNGYQFFSTVCFSNYVSYDFTNTSASTQTDFYLTTKVLKQSLSPQLLRVNAFVSQAMIVALNRSIITGSTLGGNFKNIGVTSEGFMKVAISEPSSAFDSILATSLKPAFQYAFTYNLLDPNKFETFTGLGGGATAADQQMVLTTSTTADSYSILRTRRKIHYRPGEGARVRFTAIFNTGVANSTQQAGIATAGYGYIIGYNGTDFGVMRKDGGLVHIVEVTVTTAASSAGDVTITLNGDAYTVALTDAGADDAPNNYYGVNFTAYEIAQGDYSGNYYIEVDEDKVIFIGSGIGPKSNTYSFVDTDTTGATLGSFTTVTTGVGTAGSLESSGIDNWTLQSNFNLDTLDGTGSSGITLDPTKGNVYQITFQWLGYGAITFFVEDSSSGSFIPFHRIAYANANVLPSVGIPTFPMSWSVSNGYDGASSTTAMTLKGSSCGGFIEGEIERVEPRFSFSNSESISGTTEINVLAIKCTRQINGFASQEEIFVSDISISADTGKNVIIHIYLNPTALGNGTTVDFPTWIAVGEFSGTATDIQSVSHTGGTLLYATTLSKTGTVELDMRVRNILLEVGDILVITAQPVSTTTGDVIAVINWVEEL